MFGPVLAGHPLYTIGVYILKGYRYTQVSVDIKHPYIIIMYYYTAMVIEMTYQHS